MSFPTAADARKRSRNLELIHNEITAIETAIISSSSAGNNLVEISNTIMTTPNSDEAREYYLVWAGHTVNEILTDRMNEVIRSFKDRGYVISQKTNHSTLNTFIWIVRW